MNLILCYVSRHPHQRLRLLALFQKYSSTSNYNMESVDTFTAELVYKNRSIGTPKLLQDIGVKCFKKKEDFKCEKISHMSSKQLEYYLNQACQQNDDSQFEKIITDCTNIKITIAENVVIKFLKLYSETGKLKMVNLLQTYCLNFYPDIYAKNGEFQHYFAKALCMRGNTDKGLVLLKELYCKYTNLRSVYRGIYRELIYDAVMNRSEASLIVFKKNIMEISEMWGDHYPLVCLWHICWASTWFSDQMLGDELLDESLMLQNIIKDKASAFSITILKFEFNDDAVVRLLQTLLKYKMMDEYSKVLQILFNYKLRFKDIRGCTEIIHNCTLLGISLPIDQQGRYIRMLIDGNTVEHTRKVPDFKMKF